MLRLSSSGKVIGTPVRCPKCRYPNHAVDIWCARCLAPLDWSRGTAEKPVAPLLQPAAAAGPGPYAFCFQCGAANAASDRFCGHCGSSLEPGAGKARMAAPSPPVRTRPALRLPRFQLPRIERPRVPALHWRRPEFGISVPRVPRTVGIVAAVVVILLLAPLAYVLLPSSRPAPSHLASTSGTAKPTPVPGSLEAVAIAGVEAKTGARYGAQCAATAACLSVISQTMGESAAAVLFSTAKSGGRQCAGYVYQSGNQWHFLDAVCGTLGQVAPLPGRPATVHIRGNCVNMRSSPGLKAAVVGCAYDGTAVTLTGGPAYADGHLWWRAQHGWLAHDYLRSA